MSADEIRELHDVAIRLAGLTVAAEPGLWSYRDAINQTVGQLLDVLVGLEHPRVRVS